MAYQEFLRANGINPEDLSQKDYSDVLNTQEMYNDDLVHFSNSDNCKEVGGTCGVSGRDTLGERGCRGSKGQKGALSNGQLGV